MALTDIFSASKPAFLVEEHQGEDIRDLADIHAACFGEPWTDGTLRELIEAPGCQVLSVVLTGAKKRTICGFILFRKVAKEAEILTIAVSPSFQKQGAGTALLQGMIRHCQAERLDEIFLEVAEQNAIALDLYRKAGFQKVGMRKGYYKQKQADGEDLSVANNALIMRLDLTR